MPVTAETTASIAFAADLLNFTGRMGHVNEAKRLAADTSNAALRAAMISGGIASDHATVVALDAATAHLARAEKNMANVRWMQDLITVHAPAIDAAADALVAVE